MSKLYGPDEGFEVVKNRSSKKTRVNKEKKVSQNVSLYSTVRSKISELICDQEPVMSWPPFNPVVDLNTLSHEQFVERAGAVITPFNPEGHPPPGVYSPTMRSLIDRLEVSRMTNSQSYCPTTILTTSLLVSLTLHKGFNHIMITLPCWGFMV
jgi:hypothetical protein